MGYIKKHLEETDFVSIVFDSVEGGWVAVTEKGMKTCLSDTSEECEQLIREIIPGVDVDVYDEQRVI